MTKRYRLIRELVTWGYDAKVLPIGTEFTCVDNKNYYMCKDEFYFKGDFVQKNLDWFEAIKEEEPIIIHLKLGMNFIGNINGCKTGFIVKAIETLPSSNLLVKIYASFSGDLIEFEILNEPKGLFFEYDGSKPDEVRFDGQDYILKSNSWSDNDMIEYAIWYFIDKETSGFGYTEKELLEVWKSKRRKA